MWDLPVLGPVSETNPALRASDWLYKIKPLMADLSSGSAYWWDSVVSEAQNAYDRYASSSSTLRGSIVGELKGELGDPRYTRLEARALAMLSKAVPDSVYQQALASRSLTTVGLLFQVLKSFQPGGLLERQSLLRGLGELPVAASAKQGVETLQTWFRWLARARSMTEVQIPDCSILLAALDVCSSDLLEKYPQVGFRCSAHRHAYRLDHCPTLCAVEEYGKSLLAEFEDLSINVEVEPESLKRDPKVSRLECSTAAGEYGGDEWAGYGSVGACRGWVQHRGCRFGAQCKFKHDVEKSAGSCKVCGAENHPSGKCRRPGGGAGEGAWAGSWAGSWEEVESPQKPQINKTVIEDIPVNDTPGRGTPSAPTPSAVDGLVSDVSNLLKSIRLASLHVCVCVT